MNLDRISHLLPYEGAHGSLVVKALGNEPEGHGFETR
jgi:hypothetical protein